MLRRTLFGLTLLLCVPMFVAVFAAQRRPNLATQPTGGKPSPLLSPDGFDGGGGNVYPGVQWQQASPESEGFSSARLEALRALLKTHQTDAMMIVSRGRIVFAYGDVSLVSKVASVRKSVLDLLFAVEKQKGLKLDDYMNQTVVQLGLEDKVPFVGPEQRATLEQLMMARSGIYRFSGNPSDDEDTPPRHSYYPGTHFFYYNWDFDAAGGAFEKITHQDIFDALRDDLAVPLRFQDFDRSHQKKNLDPVCNYPEYAMYLSARDMGRLGLLAMRKGIWGKTVWGDPDFIQYSTWPTTHFDEARDNFESPGWTGRWGFGALWWVWDAPKYPEDAATGPYQGAFSAMGTGGQYITVFPVYDIVVTHKVDIDQDESRDVSPATYMTILDMVLDAKCGATDKDCK